MAVIRLKIEMHYLNESELAGTAPRIPRKAVAGEIREFARDHNEALSRGMIKRQV